jgi:hypothetical protein
MLEAIIWSATAIQRLLTLLPAFVAVSLTPTTWTRLIKWDLCLLRLGQTERLRIEPDKVDYAFYRMSFLRDNGMIYPVNLISD